MTKELKIIGSYIFSFDDFAACTRLLSESKVDATPIITHRMDLSRGVEAFELLRNNRDGKAVKVILTNRS